MNAPCGLISCDAGSITAGSAFEQKTYETLSGSRRLLLGRSIA
jgi:hypothetical protein